MSLNAKPGVPGCARITVGGTVAVMTTPKTAPVPAESLARDHRDDGARGARPALLIGAVAFFAGGITHPTDSGAGNKVQQLHEMLVDPRWYPSHAALLVAMASFAVAFAALRRRAGDAAPAGPLLKAAVVVGCIATASMGLHLFAALGAESLEDGQHSVVSRLQTVNETAVDAAWGLAVAAVATVGGLTKTAGNRLTAPLGLVGGLAFALASATIAYTDTFDGLFALGSLVSVWAVAVAVVTPGVRRA